MVHGFTVQQQAVVHQRVEVPHQVQQVEVQQQAQQLVEVLHHFQQCHGVIICWNFLAKSTWTEYCWYEEELGEIRPNYEKSDAEIIPTERKEDVVTDSNTRAMHEFQKQLSF